MSFEVPYQLIQSVKKGDKQAFGRLIDCCSPYVYAVALKLIGDADDANDASQECFIKVWGKMNTYKSHYKFSTWLYKIIANTCLDKLRKRRRENQIFEQRDPDIHEPTQNNVEVEFEEKQFVDFVRTISGGLSPKQHAVFVLHDLEELSQEEISKILGMPKGRIKSNLYYARKSIRQILQTVDQEKNTSSYEL
ncbi:MAG: RNA polymerase sigma factor [Cytophagales bacterium]|nr:RNA polymerase sigma factor [Cytophagales bacterium]